MLHIEQLTVSAFRGIPGEIALTFDAPLTVLCAPNGTGKTSICDAIEWVLTEHVHRLDNTEENAASTGWRCIFSKPETRTLVAAKVVRGTKNLRLIRRHDPDSFSVREGNAGEQHWQPGKLLDWLAPQAAPESLRPNARIVRQRNWLSSTHLLSAERFGILLDTDSRSQQARQELFADLLGVGELERTRSRIEKVSKELEKTDQNERRALQTASLALSTLEKQLKQSGALPDLAAVKNAVLGIVADLGMVDIDVDKLQRDDAIGQIIGQLKDAAVAQKVALDQAEPLWQTVESRLAFYEGRSAAVEAAKADLPTLRVQLGSLREEITKLEEEVASLASGMKTRTEYTRLRTASLAALHAATPLVQDFALRNELLQSSLGNLVEALESISPSDIDDAIDRMDRARDAAERMKAFQDRVVDLQSQLAKLPVDQILRERAAEQQRRLESARENRTRLETDRASLSSAAEQLVALGHEIARRGPDSGDCPLCGHQWGDVRTLLAAIDRVSSALGPQVASITARLDEAAATLRTAEEAIEAVALQVKQRQAMESEIEQLDKELHQYRELLRAARIESAQLPSAAFLSESAAGLRARHTTSQAVQRLRETSPDFLSAFAESDCASAFRAHEEAVRSQLATIAEEAKADSSRQESCTKLLAERRQTAAVASARVDALETLLSEATDMTSRADAAAEVLSLRLPLSRKDVNKARSEWLARREKLKQTEATLFSASSALLLLQQQAHLGQLKTACDGARQRVSRVAQQCKLMQELRAFVEETLAKAKNDRLAAIQRGVQALFLRMHANRLFDAINPTNDAAGFGAAVEKEFFKSEDLSQGQRQDLALAIFISRARAYGGTFFLDEPLLHLDDLNRLALLDVFRALAIQDGSRVRLVLTTASSHVLSHIQQKFDGTRDTKGRPLLRVYHLSGTPKEGVQAHLVPA
jgi:exonuclease SbcC